MNRSDEPNITSLHALMDVDGTRPNPDNGATQIFGNARIIIGVDVMSQRQFLIFGRDEIRRIAEAPPGPAIVVRTLHVGLDQDSDELATLCGVVVSFKGHHDYVAGQPLGAG